MDRSDGNFKKEAIFLAFFILQEIGWDNSHNMPKKKKNLSFEQLSFTVFHMLSDFSQSLFFFFLNKSWMEYFIYSFIKKQKYIIKRLPRVFFIEYSFNTKQLNSLQQSFNFCLFLLGWCKWKDILKKWT